jgi:Holliday junction resolvase RusA-like endonuclease
MWPLEFVVRETPRSSGSTSAARGGTWQTLLKKVAKTALSSSRPVGGEFFVSITYLVDHVKRRKPIPDTDNINKPIIDSLIDVVYDDDKAVTDVLTRKRDLDGDLEINHPSQALMDGLSSRGDLLHVLVDDAPIRDEHL